MFKRKDRPDGSSKQFIVICNKPGMKFTFEQGSPAWMELKEEERNGTLQFRVPHLNKPRAGDLMTEEMLAEMTFAFDGFGEFRTDNKTKAIAAMNAARDIDREARLHSTSLTLEEELLAEVGARSLAASQAIINRPPMSTDEMQTRINRLESALRDKDRDDY